MKKLLTLALVALSIGLTSCSEEDLVCCDGGNSALYAGQTDICYGDNAASRTLDQDEWRDYMENIGCFCN